MSECNYMQQKALKIITMPSEDVPCCMPEPVYMLQRSGNDSTGDYQEGRKNIVHGFSLPIESMGSVKELNGDALDGLFFNVN